MWHFQAAYTENADGWRWYTVREVYPDIDLGNGPQTRWTGPIRPGGETLDELVQQLEMMLADVQLRTAFRDEEE
jgi:hypothetical protein